MDINKFVNSLKVSQDATALIKMALLKYMGLGWESDPGKMYYTIENNSGKSGGEQNIQQHIIVQDQERWNLLLDTSDDPFTFHTYYPNNLLYFINGTGIYSVTHQSHLVTQIDPKTGKTVETVIPPKPEDQRLNFPAPPIDYRERVLMTGSQLEQLRQQFKNNPTFFGLTLEQISLLLGEDFSKMLPPDKGLQRWADQAKARVQEVLQSQGMKAAQLTAIGEINEFLRGATNNHFDKGMQTRQAVFKIALLKYMGLGWESNPKTIYFTVESTRNDSIAVPLSFMDISTNVIVQTEDGWKTLSGGDFSDLEISQYDGTFVTGLNTFVYLINSTGVHEPEEYWAHKAGPLPPEPAKPSPSDNQEKPSWKAPLPDDQKGVRGLDGKWYKRQ